MQSFLHVAWLPGVAERSASDRRAVWTVPDIADDSMGIKRFFAPIAVGRSTKKGIQLRNCLGLVLDEAFLESRMKPFMSGLAEVPRRCDGRQPGYGRHEILQNLQSQVARQVL